MKAMCINHPSWVRAYNRKADRLGVPQDYPQGIKTGTIYEIDRIFNGVQIWYILTDEDGPNQWWHESHFELLAY